jgi:hypothetical protein
MAKEPTCLVCEKVMEKGFMTELGDYNQVRLPRWTAGEPEASWLSGEAKASQRREGLKVVAYRCPECEALRLYAPSA